MGDTRPGIVARARIALKVFGNGLPGRPWQSGGKKKGPMLMWPSWTTGNPQWQLIDYQAYVNEGFNFNSLIYSAINYKVRASYAAVLRAYKGDPENPDAVRPSHPLAQLIMRPNDYQSTRQVVGSIVTSLNVAGNAYVWFERTSARAVPAAMWCLRPDRVFIVPSPDNKKDLLGYLYVPEGKAFRDGTPILPQDLAHVKLPNPGDPMEGLGYGLSPLSPLASSADVDNSITKFLKIFFDKGTAPMGLLKFKQPLDDPTVATIKERWMEQYGSFENWAEIGGLDNEGDFEAITPTFSQLGFEPIDERNESRILGPLGVPGILVGTRIGLMRSSYSNFEEARKQFWEDTFVPELSLVEDELAYFLQADDGRTFGRFDLSGVKALQASTPALIGAFAQAVATGITKNQAAQLLELELGDMADGDVVYMSGALQAVYDPNAPEPEPAPPATPPDQASPIPEPKPSEQPDTSGDTNTGAPEAVADAAEKSHGAAADAAEKNHGESDDMNLTVVVNTKAMEEQAEAALQQSKVLTELIIEMRAQPEQVLRLSEQILALGERMGTELAENRLVLAQQSKALRAAVESKNAELIVGALDKQVKAIEAMGLKMEALVAPQAPQPIIVPPAEVTVIVPKVTGSRSTTKLTRDKDKRVIGSEEVSVYSHEE